MGALGALRASGALGASGGWEVVRLVEVGQRRKEINGDEEIVRVVGRVDDRAKGDSEIG